MPSKKAPRSKEHVQRQQSKRWWQKTDGIIYTEIIDEISRITVETSVMTSQFPSIIAELLHAKLKDGMKSEEQSTTQILELLELARTLPLTTDRLKIPLRKISFIFVFSMDISSCNSKSDCKMRMSRARYPSTRGIIKDIKEDYLSVEKSPHHISAPPNLSLLIQDFAERYHAPQHHCASATRHRTIFRHGLWGDQRRRLQRSRYNCW